MMEASPRPTRCCCCASFGFWMTVMATVIGLGSAFFIYRGWAKSPPIAAVPLLPVGYVAGGANVEEEAAAADTPVPAPDFPPTSEWLNIGGGKISMRDLRGKIVLLDFWTYCCINCIHILPDLQKLEEKYKNQLVVVGVHTAKFDTEKDSKNIREAILRYHIEHPVVNDSAHVIWNNYGVVSWPTFYLIDPEGNVHGRASGEGLLEVLEKNIDILINKHRAKKTLNEQPLQFKLEKFAARKEAPLYFPGKVVADHPGKRIFIADSSNNRVVITDLNGKKLDVAGTGQVGREDGSFDRATFSDPQGMALVGETLYVADRKNHSIRALDLKARTVKMFAGTGAQTRERRLSGPPLTVPLNSPWDLWHFEDSLYIAMAGHHQIWRLNLKTNRIVSYAGSGMEEIIDGSPSKSAFAQPSGLTSDGTWLYVADSEVSAIRAVSLKQAQVSVKTIVGTGLFAFADVDGVGNAVRLQHCIGVAHHGGKLYVADTYNNKIKVLDPTTRRCDTYLGDGKPGKDDSPPRFDEPAGVNVADDLLYVADTNNHAIRIIDLKTKTVRTLSLEGVTPPAKPETAKRPAFPNPQKAIALSATTIPADGELTLSILLKPAMGLKLTADMPLTYYVESKGGTPFEQVGDVELNSGGVDIKIPIAKLMDAKTLKVSVSFMMCREGREAFCQMRSQTWDIPIKTDAAGKQRVLVMESTATLR